MERVLTKTNCLQSAMDEESLLFKLVGENYNLCFFHKGGKFFIRVFHDKK